MEVTTDLRKSIRDAVMTITKGAKEETVVSDIIAIFEKQQSDIVDMAGKKRIPVKYVGKRPSYTDGLFGTGLWSQGDVKLVSVTTATQMLEHKDVYADGAEEDSIDVIDVDEKKIKEDNEKDRIEETRNLVSQMTRKATVAEFVSTNYNGLKIPEECLKLDEMKQFAIQQIDRYGII